MAFHELLGKQGAAERGDPAAQAIVHAAGILTIWMSSSQQCKRSEREASSVQGESRDSPRLRKAHASRFYGLMNGEDSRSYDT